MKRLHAIVLILFCFSASGKITEHSVKLLTKDSLPKELNEGWFFHQGDSMDFRSQDFNDSGWQVVA